MENWVLGYGCVGLMIRGAIKLKMDIILNNKPHYSIIPLFHYSTIEAKSQTSKIPIFY
jgi:hypothetical protein